MANAGSEWLSQWLNMGRNVDASWIVSMIVVDNGCLNVRMGITMADAIHRRSASSWTTWPYMWRNHHLFVIKHGHSLSSWIFNDHRHACNRYNNLWLSQQLHIYNCYVCSVDLQHHHFSSIVIGLPQCYTWYWLRGCRLHGNHQAVVQLTRFVAEQVHYQVLEWSRLVTGESNHE